MARKRFDTQLAIYSPPDPSTVDDRGTVGRDMTLERPGWGTLSKPTSSSDETGRQAGDSQTFTVEMNRDDNLALGWRLDVLSGPYAGRSLYVQSVDFPDRRTMNVTAVMTRRT